MTRPNSATENVERAARQAAAHPWVEGLARFGIAAKGIVYAIVGILAAQVAFGRGGKTTDTQGALEAIITQPFGKILLVLVAIGLVGYVMWRFVQAFLDPERKGTDAKGLFQRFCYFNSGIIYAGLALTAIKIILGSATSNSNSTQDWTARLLLQPFGQWLVATFGVIILATSFYQFYEAFSAKFRQKLKWQEMSQDERTWATRTGRFGYGARGIVFLVIGFFLMQAARQSDATQARGLDGALAALAQQPYGPWILGVVAIGLVAYGIHKIVEARYRRVVTT